MRALLRDRFELMLAARLLRSRRSAQLSIVSWMSTMGIALGVAALIVVLAVNTGFQAAFQDRILSTYPHLVVMRRGLDMDDWRGVTSRIGTLPWVRSAVPATYDDMMLASAGGRAGAVVRGIPAATLAQLPDGLVIQGAVDLQGEAPAHAVVPGTPERLQLRRFTAGGRHVVVRGAGPRDDALAITPLLAPQAGFAGLVLFDAGGCRGTDAPVGELVLDRGADSEPQRRAPRKSCDVAAWWELLDGEIQLVWHVGERELRKVVPLRAGETTFVAIQGDSATVLPPPSDVPLTAAGALVVNLGATPLRVELPADRPVQPAAGQPAGERPADPASGADGRAAADPDLVAVAELAPGDSSGWLVRSGELPAIALGEGLAAKLGAKIGDEVRAVSPMRADGDGGRGVRGVDGRFTVRAIVRTGFYDHDQRLALVDFSAAQRFLGRGDVARWVDVRTDEPILARSRIPAVEAALEPRDLADLLEEAADVRTRLARIQQEIVPGLEVQDAPTSVRGQVDNWLAGVRAARQARKIKPAGLFRVMDWEEMNRNIFDAARMQKVAMSLFPFIIVLVAALNVVGTQAVIVHERARDIAILRAMGARRRSIGAIFLVQGLAVGVVGTLLGLLVGGLCCVLLDVVGYPLDPHVYLISRLPVLIEVQPFLLAGGSAIALCFGAAWAAARRAADRAPVDGLRRLD